MTALGVVQVVLIVASAWPIACLASWVDDARKTPASDSVADSPVLVGAVESAPAVETPACSSGACRRVSGRGGYLPWED